MANWAFTMYAIEGPKETLQKIEQAILHHDVEEGSSKDWEGNVLKALGLSWENNTPDGKGKYMRGFIEGEPWWDKDALRVDAQEAWGVTDFNEVLEENFPDIKVYYYVEEEGDEVFATNDKEGKYFRDRYYVDTCVKGNYRSEYFIFRASVYKWLYDITDGEIRSEEDVDKFNERHNSDDEDFVNVHAVKIVE